MLTTDDLDAIEALATEDTRLQQVPDIHRRFLLSLLSRWEPQPPRLDEIEDVPPTDERLIDWWHGARAALLRPAYECPQGDEAMDIITVFHRPGQNGGALAADVWTEINFMSEIGRDDTGEAYFVNEGGYDRLRLPPGEYAIQARQVLNKMRTDSCFAQMAYHISDGAANPGELVYFSNAGSYQPGMWISVDGDFTLDDYGVLHLSATSDKAHTTDWTLGYYSAAFLSCFGTLRLLRRDAE